MHHPESQQGGQALGGDTIKAVIDRIAAGDHSSAEALLKGVTDSSKKLETGSSKGLATKTFFQSLLHSMSQRCHLEDVEWCLNFMSERGVQLTTNGINGALHACARVGNVGAAEKWFSNMPSNGLSPNVVSFNNMINTCARCLDTKRAEIWFNKMQEQGVAPTLITFGSLVDAFAKVGKVNEAEAWAQGALDAGLELDQVIYNSLLHAAAKSGSQSKAEHWLQRMIDSSIVPNEKAFSSLILTCSKSGDLERAKHWFKLMVNSGCKVDMICFSSMINVSARVGDSRQAEHWMEQLLEHGFAPNMICYNTLLHACAKDGNYPRTIKWITRLLEAGMTPNEITFNTLVQVSAAAGLQRDAEFWLIRMICEGHWPDKMTLRVLCRAGSRHAAPGAKNLPAWVNAALSTATRQPRVRRRQAPGNAPHLAQVPPQELVAEASVAADLEQRAKEVCGRPLLTLLRDGSVGAQAGAVTCSSTDQTGASAAGGKGGSVPSDDSSQRASKKAVDAGKFGTWPLKDTSSVPSGPAYESESLSFASAAEEYAPGIKLRPGRSDSFASAATTCSSMQAAVPGGRRGGGQQDFNFAKFGTWPLPSKQAESADAGMGPSLHSPSAEASHFQSTQTEASSSSSFSRATSGSLNFESFPNSSGREHGPAQPCGGVIPGSPCGGTGVSSQPITPAVPCKKPSNAFNFNKFGTWPTRVSPIQEQEPDVFGLQVQCVADYESCSAAPAAACGKAQPEVPAKAPGAVRHLSELGGVPLPRAASQYSMLHAQWPIEVKCAYSKPGTIGMSPIGSSRNEGSSTESAAAIDDSVLPQPWPERVFDAPEESCASISAGRSRRTGKKLDLSKFGTWPQEGPASSVIHSADRFATDFFEAPIATGGQEGLGWSEQHIAGLGGSGHTPLGGGVASS